MYPIIAICGKSASGKDTLAKNLSHILTNKNIDNKILVSDTTRPSRVGEIDGVSYNFISKKEFLQNIYDGKMLEYSKFRGWYYGTSSSSLEKNKWNIGVFNADGIHALIKKQTADFKPVIYIYLYANPWIRLRRSYEREGQWKMEFFRRMFADWKDFRRFKNLTKKQKYGIIIKNETNNFTDNHVWMVNNVLSKMLEWKMI